MPLRPLMLATIALAAAPLAAQAFTLHVLHINDFHSRIEAINAFDSTCSDEEEAAGECFGGAARLFTAINGLRDPLEAAGENVIVIDAGDEFQGSLFFTTYAGQTEAEMMNRIGFDAMVFGNHEFDLGPEPLAKFIETAEFPVIAGSVDVSGDDMLAGLAEEQVVLELGGEKVAILGATTPDTPEIASPGPTDRLPRPRDLHPRQDRRAARPRGSTRSSSRATSGCATTSRSPRRSTAST